MRLVSYFHPKRVFRSVFGQGNAQGSTQNGVWGTQHIGSGLPVHPNALHGQSVRIQNEGVRVGFCRNVPQSNAPQLFGIKINIQRQI